DRALALLATRRSGHATAWTAAPEAEERRGAGTWASPPPQLERRGVLTGVGVALCVERAGGLFEHATVRALADGYVVSVGSTPSGQGQHTLFAQIAASRLGVEAS